MKKRRNGKRLETKTFSATQAESSAGRMAFERTLAELAQQFDTHPNQITSWKRRFSESTATVFDRAAKIEFQVKLEALHAKI